jgi:hypothetical protein
MSVALEKLKQLPGIVKILPEGLAKECYSFSLLPAGLPKTGLVEVSGLPGSGKTQAILQFLQENPALYVAWIEKDFTLFPPSFSEHWIHLERILFLDLDSTAPQSPPFSFVSNAIKSQLFQLIVLSQLHFTEVDLRRLQLLCKQTGSLAILLNEHALSSSNWPISLQLVATRSSCFEGEKLHLSILKRRSAYL